MTVTIRPAEKNDVQALAGLIGEIECFYGADASDLQPLDERRAQIEEALFGTPPLASALVAEDDDGDLVGLAAYSFLWPATGTTHSLYLKELYVRDTARGQGAGGRLMEELHAIAAARPNCTRIEWTADHDNPPAQAFYRALGFEEFAGKIFYRVGVDRA